jgi:hypothetical protein
MNKDYFSLIGFFGIVITLIIIGKNNNKPDNYGSYVDNEQYNKYTQKHPVIGNIKPLHPKVRNDFQMRSFVLGTSKFYGELDGLGRTPFAYAGLKANPEDQEVIRNIVREVILELEKNGSRKKIKKTK